MWQMVFTHISIEGWIVDPYVQILFYCSHLVQVLPPNNVKVVDGNIVTSDVALVIYGEGGFKCSLNLSPNILAFTICHLAITSAKTNALVSGLTSTTETHGNNISHQNKHNTN